MIAYQAQFPGRYGKNGSCGRSGRDRGKVEKMAIFTPKHPQSAEERVRRRRLVLSSSLSLAALCGITMVLAFVTNRFYASYATHQAELATRWEARGAAALKKGDPTAAITALRSALAYAPGSRMIEIELAEALASGGYIQEATAYFNTLAEAEPGSGQINLQLARLAVRRNEIPQALEYYQRAIYGNWEGNGYLLRRQVRIELIEFLISRQLYDQARNELLVAAGNAPENDSAVLLQIASLMEQAQDPANALRIYRKILGRTPALLPALLGAGRAAYDLGYYGEAQRYLTRAAGNRGFEKQPAELVKRSRDTLREVSDLLRLYPSSRLGIRAQATRIVQDLQLARARFSACLAMQPPARQVQEQASGPVAPASQLPGQTSLKGTLENLESRLTHHNAKPAADERAQPPPSGETLNALSARWQEQPENLTAAALANDPDLVQSEIQLIYDTERITGEICGPPTGDDALLLKIAQAPDAVEQR